MIWAFNGKSENLCAFYEIAKRVSIIVIAPLAFVALSFLAMIGGIIHCCLSGRVQSQEPPPPDPNEETISLWIYRIASDLLASFNCDITSQSSKVFFDISIKCGEYINIVQAFVVHLNENNSYEFLRQEIENGLNNTRSLLSGWARMRDPLDNENLPFETLFSCYFQTDENLFYSIKKTTNCQIEGQLDRTELEDSVRKSCFDVSLAQLLNIKI